MIKAFSEGKDIYATIASIAFNVPYEECLEFHPDTHEYQKDGKARRGEAKSIVLGVSYGRSVATIAEQLFGADDTLTDEEKVKKAQNVYDSVMNAFPNLRQLMIDAQATATQKGYVETILGRRRHIPDMMLPPFDFKPLPGYVNPDIDPLDPATLKNKEQIPKRIVDSLKKEYASFKYNGQRYKRNKQLHEEGIKVIDNRSRIADASRECVNCVDYETEILTQSGWKTYKDVAVGDKILSYSMDTHQIVEDAVEAVHIYDEPQEVVKFESTTISAVSTMNHRWIVGDYGAVPTIKTSEDVYNQAEAKCPILLTADNAIPSGCSLSDAELIAMVQDSIFCYEYLTFEFISLLSRHQAAVLARAMLQRDIPRTDSKIILTKQVTDAFQYLCVKAGYATISYHLGPYSKWYLTCIMPDTRSYIHPGHKTIGTADGVWCVTTHEGTWIARRNGKVYITGNSIIQGSASELTKMAILRLINDPRWKAFGGRLLVPVHDELIAEVPLEYAEEAGEILIECMCEAGSFLPFTISCDLETTERWYGLSLESITKHAKPDSFDNLSEDNIKWIQCHLCEMEYVLPLFNDEDGNKPRGDAAHGVSGQWSSVMDESIADYCSRYNVSRENFFDDIELRVQRGYIPKTRY